MLRLLESRETEYRARIKRVKAHARTARGRAHARNEVRCAARAKIVKGGGNGFAGTGGKYRGALSGSIKTAYDTGGQVADAALKRAGVASRLRARRSFPWTGIAPLGRTTRACRQRK